MMFYRGTGSDNQDCAGTGTAYELAAMLIYVCDQQVSFGQIMFSPPNKIFPVRRSTYLMLYILIKSN